MSHVAGPVTEVATERLMVSSMPRAYHFLSTDAIKS